MVTYEKRLKMSKAFRVIVNKTCNLKDIHCNYQNEKCQQTNNGQQNTTLKDKDRATRTPLSNGDQLCDLEG